MLWILIESEAVFPNRIPCGNKPQRKRVPHGARQLTFLNTQGALYKVINSLKIYILSVSHIDEWKDIAFYLLKINQNHWNCPRKTGLENFLCYFLFLLLLSGTDIASAQAVTRRKPDITNIFSQETVTSDQLESKTSGCVLAGRAMRLKLLFKPWESFCL